MKFPTLTIAALSLAAPALAQDATTLTVDRSEEVGPYLATAEGLPVYMFTTDTRGTDDQQPEISCTSDECLEIWPLVTTTGAPKAGDSVDDSLLGTIEYEGQTVVTYNGWPLYHFARDKGREFPQGNDNGAFGGEWYLMTPAGNLANE